MILGGLKKRISQKQLNNILFQRQADAFDGFIDSVGVVLNIDEDQNLDRFRALCDDLKIHPNKVTIIGFSQRKKEKTNSWDHEYYAADFNWKGKVKNVELQAFLNSKFDLLISYYGKDIIELKLITAYSKAKLKIGILQNDERINDLIIKTSVKQFEVFKKELFKYLNILSKVKNE